jgi:phospholipid transport system substrate-binding protein
MPIDNIVIQKSWSSLILFSAFVSCPAYAAAPTPSEDAAAVRTVIETSVNSVLEVLKQKGLEREVRKKKVLDVVGPVFDLQLMGKLVLGRTHWPKLNEAQRKEFIELFVKTIHDSYYEKLDLFTDETVDFGAPAPGEKGKYEMAIRIVSKGQRYKLLYKLYRVAATWKVYDIEIEGISLVRTYGAQYDQALQKSSIDELLAKMREKSLTVPEDLKKATKGKS